MKWIASEGGPLILMEERLLPLWTGCFSADDSEFKSDYERACAVDGYAGVTSVSNGSALVLGDEPCQAAFGLGGTNVSLFGGSGRIPRERSSTIWNIWTRTSLPVPKELNCALRMRNSSCLMPRSPGGQLLPLFLHQ